jgi:nitrous oxidase accessory protein
VRWAQTQFPAILPGGIIDSAPLMRAPDNPVWERYKANHDCGTGACAA